MHAIIAGPDLGLADQLDQRGVDVTRIEGMADRPTLEDAGILDADLFVLTDVRQSTAIPVSRDLHDGIRVVVYAHDTVPEFVRGQPVLIVDPDLLGPDAVAEELLADR